MYQELIARITAERDVRHATLTQMMINRLQELGAPSDVVMTAAVYYLHGVIATEDELAAQYGLPPSSVGYLQGLRCRGLKPKGKARVWEMNVRRYYFHVKGDIAGHPELELLQTVISEARIRTYTCAAGYGKGLSYLAAEVLYMSRIKNKELREHIYRAVREVADRIGFDRADVEARIYQMQGYIAGLYPDVYHNNPHPGRYVTLPKSWKRQIDVPVDTAEVSEQ